MITVPLSVPIDVAGATVSELVFRAPTIGDLRSAARGAEPFDIVASVLAKMANLTVEQFDQLSIADFDRINGATAPLLAQLPK